MRTTVHMLKTFNVCVTVNMLTTFNTRTTVNMLKILKPLSNYKKFYVANANRAKINYADFKKI